MIKVTVKTGDTVTHGGQFNNQAEVSEWIARNEAVKAFGKPERWIHEDDLDALGEEKLLAIASEDVGGPDEDRKRYKFPAEYTIEVEDISAQILAEVEKEQALDYLKATDWYVLRKVETGVDIPAEVAAARSQARVKLGRI